MSKSTISAETSWHSGVGNANKIQLPDGSLIAATAGRTQLAFAEILHRPAFEHFLGVVIICNLIATVVETDIRASDDKVPQWMAMLDVAFIAFYALEMSLRLYIWRLPFFHDRTHIFEALLVAGDIVFQLAGELPNLKVLRVVRLLRLARTLRIMMHFRELYIMAHGMIAALKALFWAAVMLTVWLTVWSIVTVEIIHPLNEEIAATGVYGDCDRCGRAYSSVPQSVLTYIQQIVAGDSWGMVTIPILERYPATMIVFFSVLITVNFGILNLVLAVIVDKAHQAREADVEMRMREKREEWNKAKKELTEVCDRMDEDKSGQLTLRELLGGYDNDVEFRSLINMMDVQREDLNTLFDIFDRDQSGSVTHKEFIKELHKMKTEDSHMMLVLLKHKLVNLEKFVRDFVKDFRGQRLPPKVSDFGNAPMASLVANLPFSSNEAGVVSPMKQDKLSLLEMPPVPPRLLNIGDGTVSANAASILPMGGLDEAVNRMKTHVEEQLAVLSKEISTKVEVHARSHDRRLDAILGSLVSGSKNFEQATSPDPRAGRIHQQQQQLSARPGVCMPNTCNGVFGLPP